MKIAENANFVRVSEYKKSFDIEAILSAFQTAHLSEDRQSRLDLATRLNRFYVGKGKDKKAFQAEIDKVFLVDKGHIAGAELHCVTKKGIIFILNERKLRDNENAFITALIGRRNQVARLYEDCGFEADEDILEYCAKWQAQGYNQQ